MFLERLCSQMVSGGDDVCVITPDDVISYAQMGLEIHSLSAWLLREGLEPGNTVGLTIKAEYEHLITSLALMRLGCIHVTLPSHEPSEYRQVIAQRTKAIAILADRPENGIPGIQTILPDYSFRLPLGKQTALPAFQPHDAVCMYFTSSGTTGRPKLIPVTFKQLSFQARLWQWPAHRDVFYRPTPVEFSNSKRNRLYSLFWGSINVLIDSSRQDIYETCYKFNVTRLNISALQARTLLDRSDNQKLPSETHVRIGGSAVSPQLRREVIDRLTPNLHVTYAASEVGSISTAGPSLQWSFADTIGIVHPGIRLEIVDETHRSIPPNEPGRIRIKSPAAATHYFDDDEATAKAFQNGWFYPGDIGHVTKQGHLYLDGRADEMISLASISIFPAEIERALEGFPGIIECAAFSLKSPHFGDIPVLAAVAEKTLTAADILQFARRKLGLRAPRKVFFVDALPRNDAGKILRSALHEFSKRVSGQPVEEKQ